VEKYADSFFFGEVMKVHFGSSCFVELRFKIEVDQNGRVFVFQLSRRIYVRHLKMFL
jgi:hypothetical protein